MEPDLPPVSRDAQPARSGGPETPAAEPGREHDREGSVSQRTSELIQSNIRLRAALEKNEAIAASLARSE
ncbi:MAG: hypothetical protein RL375_400, partial [Pseudomonadota bacterium]